MKPIHFLSLALTLGATLTLTSKPAQSLVYGWLLEPGDPLAKSWITSQTGIT